METYSFSTLPHLIIGTDRIATIHASLAKQLMPETELITFPLPVDLQGPRQMQQWHAYRENDPGIIWLRGLFEEAASQVL